MRSAILALSSAALLTVAILAAQPAAAQSVGPTLPCNEDTIGSFTQGLAWSPPGLHAKEGSWDVYEYICSVPVSGGAPRWSRYTYPLRSLKTQDQPSGFVGTHEYDEDGRAIIVATGTKEITDPNDRFEAYWSPEGTERLRRIVAQYTSAADICIAVDETADNVTPDNAYYINGEWYHVASPSKSRFPRDAKMSAIWRNVPECGRFFLIDP